MFEIINYKTKKPYTLTPIIKCPMGEKFITAISRVCNEEKIYNLLFKKMLKGEAYTRSDAEGFLNWARTGWEAQEHFVFFILDEMKSPVGCLDIKSNDKNNAEVGYWLGHESSGIMTSALEALCSYAKDNGYLNLYADCLKSNISSQNVLLRCSFAKSTQIDKSKTNYIRYDREL